MSRGRNTLVSSPRDGDGRSTSRLRSTMSHGGRIKAKLDSRFGTTFGSIRVGAVGSHGDGAFSGVVHAETVGKATAGNSRDSRSDDWFAVYRCQSSRLCILRRGGRGRTDDDWSLRAGRNQRRLR